MPINDTFTKAQKVFHRKWQGDEEAVREWRLLKETMSEEMVDRVAHGVYLEFAEEGDTEAMYWLSDDYAKGEGCERNLERAKYWEVCAADSGNIKAILKLARLYSVEEEIEENYCEKNDSEAIKWYRKGVEIGSVECQVELAQMYLYSEITNYTEAVNLFTSAAEKGNVEAMYSLGLMYDNAKFGTEIYDEEKALYWYGLAERNGNKYAGKMREILQKSIEKDGFIGIKKNGFVRKDWLDVMIDRTRQGLEVRRQELEEINARK